MCFYSFTVAVILILNGFKVQIANYHGVATAPFQLTEAVLNFLVGSTAVTVIGLVGMVLTGVFVGARK